MYAPSQLVSRFKNNDLFKNVGITFGETFLTKGMSFLILLILTRLLGPEDYGRYSFIFVAVALLTALFDFGMENTAVRFSAKMKDREKSIFGLYALIKIIILFVLSLILAQWGPTFFHWFHKEEMIPYLPFLIAGLIGESLYFLNDTYLQATKKFTLRAVLNVLRYLTLLGYVIFLASTSQMTLHLTFYMLLMPAVFFFFFIPRFVIYIKAYCTTLIPIDLGGVIIYYQGGMLTYSVANNLIGRVDMFMLAIWVSFESLGLYNTAFQLCAVISFIPFVIGKVLLPTLSESTHDVIFQTTDRLVQGIIRLAIIGLIGIPLAYWVIPLLLGPAYSAVIPLWQILFVAFLLGFAGMPYEQALYSLGKPKVLTFSRYLQLLVVIVLHALTIPTWGIYAAAFNTLLGRFLYFIFLRKQYMEEKTQWTGTGNQDDAELTIW